MPPKRSDVPRELPDHTLRMGKFNNFVAWLEIIKADAGALYGSTARFLTTNVRYVPRIPIEADYNPAIPEVEGQPAPPALTAAAIGKLREGAYDRRNKSIEQQLKDEEKLFNYVELRLSAASLAKVKEEATYDQISLDQDVIGLWGLIRRTHLTHIYGEGDPLMEVNVKEQEIRYMNLKQGEREYISMFKTRFDNQVKANRGAGIAEITESKRALDFIYMLDQKRFGRMRMGMHNNALRRAPDAYPATLADAYRIASGWANEEPDRGSHGIESHSAFVTEESALVTKAKVPEKGKAHSSGNKSGEKARKSSSLIICYVCGVSGHYARECSLKKEGEKILVAGKGVTFAEEDEEFYDPEENGYGAIFVTTEVDIPSSKESIIQSSKESILFSKYDVQIDSQASLSLFKTRSLLRNLGPSAKRIVVNGVQADADGVIVDQEGQFDQLGKVYYSPESTANILSYAAMVDAGHAVSYDGPNDRFLLRPLGSRRVLTFSRKRVDGSENRFYCCDMSSSIGTEPPTPPAHRILLGTVSENMKLYTKREVAGANNAREMLARMGYPSVKQAIDICTRGKNFDITARDFQVADAIYGKDIASIKGKTTKQQTRVAEGAVGTSIVQQEQVLLVDVMFVEGVPSLIGLSHPLDLTLCKTLLDFDSSRPSRSATIIKTGIESFIATLLSRDFKTKRIMTDGEGAISKLVSHLNSLGVEVDVSGAGGHVPQIERRIRMVKERVRAHIAHKLPFTLTKVGIAMLVLFCVSRINFQFSSTRSDGACPRELFCGRRVDGTLDFKVGFGEYVQATVANTNNTTEARTEDCIVMLPSGNLTGSVTMMKLVNMQLVKRDQFVILPITASAIKQMNDSALKEGRTLVVRSDMTYTLDNTSNPNAPTFARIHDTVTQDPIFDINRDQIDQPDAGNSQPEATQTPTFADEIGMPEQPGPYDERGVVDTPDQSDHSDAGDTDLVAVPSPDVPSPDQPEPVQLEYSHGSRMLDLFHSGVPMQHRDTVENRGDHVLNVSLREAMRTDGERTAAAINLELSQLMAMNVFAPVHTHRLPVEQRSRVIRSKMFLKQKLHPDGTPDKYKARLVAGGDQQDKELYNDLSSPTVSTSAVLTVLSIAAYEHRIATVVDIGGAYLNADMDTGVLVHMRLDATVSSLLVKLDQSYGRYMDDRGCIVVLLKKALYGCVESAALWNKDLTKTMEGMGYSRNPYEQCVFNRSDKDGTQCTAAVHVDDLLITCTNPSMINELCHGLKTRYGTITRHDGPRINYLGMALDLSIPGEARISMSGYVEEVLKNAGIEGTAKTPATDGLFERRDGATLVPEVTRAKFHRLVAMISYLAKRTMPEALTTTGQLATQVTKCTVDDYEKLERLVRYIRYTRDRGVVLRPGALGIVVRIFVDAAYGVHADMRSHTGSCVVIGDTGAVHCRSSKQSIMTKSSTEAELVALSDSANQGLYIRNFLRAQGHDTGPVTMYQDNTSCMALVERGRSGAERTRHISIRYFWVKERVDSGEAIIEHKGTKDMYANLLTKPLQGSQFTYERECLTGW